MCQNFTISENSPKESQRRRRPSLKSTKSSEKRRSRGHSVHFVSPVTENSENVSLPHTPYNRDSLGKFNLFRPMEFPIKFETVKSGLSIVCIEGLRVNFQKIEDIYFFEKFVNFLFILYFLYATCNVSPTEKRRC